MGLFLDDFELLDGTVAEGVVRDGDLVCVKRRVGVVPVKGKREEKKEAKDGKKVKKEEEKESEGTPREGHWCGWVTDET